MTTHQGKQHFHTTHDEVIMLNIKRFILFFCLGFSINSISNAQPTTIQYIGACAGYHYSFALAAKNSNKINGYRHSWGIAEGLDSKYGKNTDYTGAKNRVLNHISTLVQNNDPNLSSALSNYAKTCSDNGVPIGQWN